MPRFDVKVVPFLVLTLLLGLGAAMLRRAPARGYVVDCERTSRTACALERTTATVAQRTDVPLGAGASAVVRVEPRRRGDPRVFLYLQTPERDVFAAEFEGADAPAAAARAAARLNGVFRGAAPAARVEVAPPPLLRRLAWAGLAVMGLLVVAGYRAARSVST